jgi:type IV secretion system protein VirD4
MPVKPPQSQTTQSQAIPQQQLQVNQNFYILGGLMTVFIIVSLLMGRTSKQGKTARARWANLDDLKHAKKLGLACKGKKARFDQATYYIVEPIGTPPKQWGKFDHNALFLPQINRGTLVIGGAGSGKTANLILPAAISALLQDHTVALFDYKYENQGLAEILVPVAIDRGYQVRTFAPGGLLSGIYNVCDGVKDSSNLAGAREVVGCIVRNTSDKEVKNDGFFDPGGRSILEGAFLMARWIAEKCHNPAHANILMVHQILSMPELTKRLLLNRESIPPWIYAAFSILTSSAGGSGKNETEAGLLANAVKVLSPMIVPDFLESLVGKSTFPRLSRDEPLKVDGKQMLIFGCDQKNEAATLPLVATALEQIVSYNLKYQRQKPLVVILDEFDALNLPVVLDWLNRYRSSGCSVIIGIQYLGQLEARYGKARAQGFQSSCSTKGWFNPGDSETAKTMSMMFGEQELELANISKSTNSGKGGGGTSRSESKQLHQVDLLESHEPLNFPQGTCIIQSPGVGNKQAIGLPFRYSFRFSKKQDDLFKAECKSKYGVLRDLATQKKGSKTTDHTKLFQEYYQIIDRLISLDPMSSFPVS